jgi:hypothetical protein
MTDTAPIPTLTGNLPRIIPTGSGVAGGPEQAKGVEKGASQTPIQPRRQRWTLPAGLTEGDLQRGYAQAVRP